jgi:hypothetical protein
MPAKELHYSDDARAKLKRGVDQLADAVKVTLGQGPERRHRQEIRLPDRHQGRRDGGQGN